MVKEITIKKDFPIIMPVEAKIQWVRATRKIIPHSMNLHFSIGRAREHQYRSPTHLLINNHNNGTMVLLTISSSQTTNLNNNSPIQHIHSLECRRA